jgi:hypothetical protein
MEEENKPPTTENLKKMSEALEGLPARLTTINMLVVMAPLVTRILKDNPEMKYRIKFSIEKVLKESKELTEECIKSLKEIDEGKPS